MSTVWVVVSLSMWRLLVGESFSEMSLKKCQYFSIPESPMHMGQHVDIAGNSKIMSESKENLGHRLKISSIGHNKAFHSISLQSLPHFDVNNIAVAQN